MTSPEVVCSCFRDLFRVVAVLVAEEIIGGCCYTPPVKLLPILAMFMVVQAVPPIPRKTSLEYIIDWGPRVCSVLLVIVGSLQVWLLREEG
jgi:hypothetical protein